VSRELIHVISLAVIAVLIITVGIIAQFTWPW